MTSAKGTYIVVTADGKVNRYRYADSRLDHHAQNGLYWHGVHVSMGGPERGHRRIATITSDGTVREYLP